MLGVSTGMIYLLIREGKLRSRALVRKAYQRGFRLIRRSDVQALCSVAQSPRTAGLAKRAAEERKPRSVKIGRSIRFRLADVERALGRYAVQEIH
jgi:predicted DNA-binding transcriptional regulator AlpA